MVLCIAITLRLRATHDTKSTLCSTLPLSLVLSIGITLLLHATHDTKSMLWSTLQGYPCATLLLYVLSVITTSTHKYSPVLYGTLCSTLRYSLMLSMGSIKYYGVLYRALLHYGASCIACVSPLLCTL